MFEMVYSNKGTVYKQSDYLDFEDHGHYVVKYNGKFYFKNSSPEFEHIINKYQIFYADLSPVLIGFDPNDKCLDILYKDKHIELLADAVDLPLPIAPSEWNTAKLNHLRHEHYIYTIKRGIDTTPFLLKLYTLSEVLDWFPSHRVTSFTSEGTKIGVLELYRRFDKKGKGLMSEQAFVGEYNDKAIEAKFSDRNTAVQLSDGRYFSILDKTVTYPNGDVHTLEQQEEYRWFHEVNADGVICFKHKFECQWDLETSVFGEEFFEKSRNKVRELFGV